MTSLSLVSFFCAHVLGDFYFQSEKLAQKKAQSFNYTMLHIAIYSAVMIVVGVALMILGYHLSWLVWVLILVSHGLIDSLKWILTNRPYVKPKFDKWLYLGDQLLHLLLISIGNAYVTGSLSLDKELAVDVLFLSKCLLLSLVIFKPANLTFKLVFEKYQYEVKERPLETQPEIKLATTVAGAGAAIGNLERLIMAIFLLLNQYGAIGLILTAKSITRYNKIATSPAFSEYYLIGTLYSLLATLLPYLVIFQPIITNG